MRRRSQSAASCPPPAPGLARAVAPELNPAPSAPGHTGSDRRLAAGRQGHTAASRRRQVGRRQRLDADLLRPGAADDRPRPGALLRRPGPQEEHPRHHDAELRHDVPGHGHLGHLGYSLAFGHGNCVHRRLRAPLSARASPSPPNPTISTRPPSPSRPTWSTS